MSRTRHYFHAARAEMAPGTPLEARHNRVPGPALDRIVEAIRTLPLPALGAEYRKGFGLPKAELRGAPLVRLMVEGLFEHVRRTHFPGRTGRWEAVYAFPHRKDAADWALAHPPRLLLHAIEQVSGKSHVGDRNWVFLSIQPQKTHFEAHFCAAYLRAMQYWEGRMTPRPQPEVLLQGKIRVLRLVQDLR